MRSWMMAAALGIAVVQLFPSLPPPQVYYLLIPCCLVWIFRRRWCICSHLTLPSIFVLGVIWACYFGAQTIIGLLPLDFEDEDIQVFGTIIELPETVVLRGVPTQRFVLAVDGAACLSSTQRRCFSHLNKIKVSWRHPEPLQSGDYWQFQLRLKRPRGYANPGGFDYQRWLVQQGIGATAYVKAGHRGTGMGTHKMPLRALIDRQRFDFAAYMDRHLADFKHLPIFKALIIADRRGISREQWALFIDTGVIHLVVISGLHIGLIAAAAFYLMRMLVACCLPMVSAERVAALLAMLVAGLYCLAAGFSLPTQRALVMVSVWLLAITFCRNLSPSMGLISSLLLCLIINPLSPLSQSFWLSFLAVAAIFIGLNGRRRRASKLSLVLAPQWAVFIGLLPLIALLQGQLNWISLPANMLLVPLFSLVVVPFSFLASGWLLADPVSSRPLWLLLDRCLSLAHIYLEQLTALLTLLPAPIIAPPPVNLLLLAVLGTLLLLLPRGTPNKGLAWILLVPLLVYRPAAPGFGGLKLSALDVGQGLSVVIQTRDHSLVYDLGPVFSDSFDTANAVVLPYLKHQGIRYIDRLVISHADSDHAGAWKAFMQTADIGQLVVGETMVGLPSNARDCRDITPWQWDGVDFEFVMVELLDLPPSGNNRSCILRITTASTTFLLTGDIERPVELRLVRQQAHRIAADILFAPHHGSDTSSSWPFIKAIKPQHVVFSSGYRNQFGHPSEAVVRRYQAFDSKLHYTNKAGTVVFEVSGKQLLSWWHFRAQQSRYWH